MAGLGFIVRDDVVEAGCVAQRVHVLRVEIQRMLQGMIKQRRESIALYQQGNRPDLAQQENEEIAVIESFLPRAKDNRAAS